jgi:hypothetical protein
MRKHSPHQFRTRNDLNKTQRTESNPNESEEMSGGLECQWIERGG